MLFTVIGRFATGILDTALFSSAGPMDSPLNGVFKLVSFLPTLAVNVRRLYYIDRTAWRTLIVFSLRLTILGVQEGTAGPNRLGPDRLAALAV